MTPKEKADKLFRRYYIESDLLQENLSTIEAKECALIAVDEIINTIEFSSQSDELSKRSYWEQVKQEIEKL